MFDGLKALVLVSLVCFALAAINLHSGTIYPPTSKSLDLDRFVTKSSSIFGITGYTQYLLELSDHQMSNLYNGKSQIPFDLDTTKFIPPNAYVVFSTVSSMMSLNTQNFNIYGRVPSAAKMHAQNIKTSIYDVMLYMDCDDLCYGLFKKFLSRQWIFNSEKISSRKIRFDFGYVPRGDVLTQIMDDDIVEWIQPVTPIVLSNMAGNNITQTASRDNIAYPIWNKGLTGSGEIISVADTGLDYDLCLFSEADKSAPPINSFDSKRRKVVGYYKVADGARVGDYVGGHGTHVAGSVAGSILAPANVDERTVNQYRGGAPDAKLAIMSIGKAVGNIIEGDGGLILPPNVTGIFRSAESGAMIFTNSWGAGAQFYSVNDRDIDQYMWNNDDILTLFAGGNAGLAYTVGSPGQAKNVLTVGATETSPAGIVSAAARFDPANNAQCCGSITGQRLCCPSWMSSNSLQFSPDNKASFSSEGNTWDERLKPEISAPGHVIVSAHSDGNLNSFQCGNMAPNGANAAALMSMSGTSMATPLLAGNAALVRQYFREGWFADGSGPSDQGITPSGSLLKAAIVHSATGKSTDVFPNPKMGFGRASLLSVLKFSDSNFNLTFQNKRPISSGQVHNYMFSATTAGQFRATIAWYDAPVSLLSRIKLVNSLMLDVWIDGVQYNANGLDYDSSDNTRQITGTVAAGSEIFVRVTAKRIITPSQSYSIVMTGQIQSTDIARECNGIDVKDPQSCNGNGFCGKSGACECKTAFSGTDCASFTCFSKNPTASDVCGGRGKCTSGNKCECADYASYGGLMCDQPVCWGALKSQPFSCGRAGTCIGPNQCQCNSPGLNKNCEADVEQGIIIFLGLGSIFFTCLCCCCVSICFCVVYGLWACLCRKPASPAGFTKVNSKNNEIVQPLTSGQYYQN